MVLGISEDYTVDIDFDSELTNIPTSGLYINSGVHPSITNENLLEFLPKTVITFLAWSNSIDYKVFTETRNKKDIVTKGGKIYQSINNSLNQDPAATDSLYWLETNMNSLRLKNFIEKVKDRVYTDLSLDKRLINNQFLYDNGDISTTLLNDYAGWVIEPKGSDYVSFRINQISIQKSGTTPINLYVINQKTLVKTITITPNNGELNFVNTDIVLSGKGVFKLVIDSTDVL
jgi:predicted DNA binding protein